MRNEIQDIPKARLQLKSSSDFWHWLCRRDSFFAAKFNSEVPARSCWREISEWAKGAEIPEKLYDKFVADLIEAAVVSGNAYDLCNYMLYVGHRDDIFEAFKATEDSFELFLTYMQHLGHREDLANRILESGKASSIFEYILYYGVTEDAVAALIKAEIGYYLYRYLKDVGHRDDVCSALMNGRNLDSIWLYDQFVVSKLTIGGLRK